MKLKLFAVILATTTPVLLNACASYGPPPPGYAGESWRQHIRRCERAYPRYDPRTDLIERSGGPVRCPL